MLRLMPRPLQFAFQSAGPPPARSLSGRLCRDASSSLPPSPDVGKFIRGTAFPIARAGLRRPQMRSAAECSRPAALFRPSDGFSARPGMSPPRAFDARPRRTAPEIRRLPPRAPQLRPYSSGSPLPVPMRKRLACAETGVHAARAAMRPARPKREVRTGAARRFRPNHAVRPPLADVRLFGNGSARNIEGLSNKSRKSGITPVGIHSGRGEIVEIRLVRQPQFAHT